MARHFWGYGPDATQKGPDSSRTIRQPQEDVLSALKLPERPRCQFFMPHDDDLIIGFGLLAQALQAAGAVVSVVVVTDGSQGYCREEQRLSISDTRRTEALEAYQSLGISSAQVRFLGFPDDALALFIGRRAPNANEPQLRGYTGLENFFTAVLRDFTPDIVFAPTEADLHFDHKIVGGQLAISIFHAAGAIWPELGEPISKVPRFLEGAVYCPFPTEPQYAVRSSEQAFEKKLRALKCFRSQEQIEALVAAQRDSDHLEVFRERTFAPFSSSRYSANFPAAESST